MVRGVNEKNRQDCYFVIGIIIMIRQNECWVRVRVTTRCNKFEYVH